MHKNFADKKKTPSSENDTVSPQSLNKMAARAPSSLADPTTGRLIAKFQGLIRSLHTRCERRQPRNYLLKSGAAMAGSRKMKTNKRTKLQKCSFSGGK
jgi:hypothetical protein